MIRLCASYHRILLCLPVDFQCWSLYVRCEGIQYFLNVSQDVRYTKSGVIAGITQEEGQHSSLFCCSPPFPRDALLFFYREAGCTVPNPRRLFSIQSLFTRDHAVYL